MKTERQQIIEQLLELHFVTDETALHAIALLEKAGYTTASCYIDLISRAEEREIENGRPRSLRVGHHKLSRMSL